MSYRIEWDNEQASDTFPWIFDAEEDAEAFGVAWQDAMGKADPTHAAAYTFRIVDIVPDDTPPTCLCGATEGMLTDGRGLWACADCAGDAAQEETRLTGGC